MSLFCSLVFFTSFTTLTKPSKGEPIVNKDKKSLLKSGNRCSMSGLPSLFFSGLSKVQVIRCDGINN